MSLHTQERRPIHRLTDGELLGYVARDGEAWLALAIFGLVLAQLPTEREAEAWLEAKGLSALAETWWYFDAELGGWFSCRLAEASSQAVSLHISDYGHPRVLGEVNLEAPDESSLSYRRP